MDLITLIMNDKKYKIKYYYYININDDIIIDFSSTLYQFCVCLKIRLFGTFFEKKNYILTKNSFFFYFCSVCF